MSPPNDISILVIGCGVFGLSTILELLQRGYKDVTGLDVSEIPGDRAAANDYNKIIRVEYADMKYTKLSVEALQQWENDPIYKPYYQKSGRLVMAPFKKENQGRAEYDLKSIENLKELGVEQRIIELKTPKEIGKLIPELKSNQFPEPLSAKYNIDSGYGEASNSLISVYKECLKLGAKFIFGPAGTVTKVGNDQVVAEDRTVYKADKIIVSAGAYTSALIDMESIVTAFGVLVSHIQLTNEEYEKYKDMPIFFSAEWGYFFPPDPIDHRIKIGLTYADIRNHIKSPFDEEGISSISIPYYVKDAPADCKEATQRLFRYCIPELSYKEPVNCKVCWISDSFDSSWVIDFEPDTNEKILVVAGDSGHGYKFLPNIGKYVVQRLEGTISQEYDELWKWRCKPAKADDSEPTSRAKRKTYDVKTVRKWIHGTKMTSNI